MKYVKLFFLVLLVKNAVCQDNGPILQYSYIAQTENPIGGSPLINSYTLFAFDNQKVYRVKVVNEAIQLVKLPYDKLPPNFDTSYFDQLKKDAKENQLKRIDIEKKLFATIDLTSGVEISHQYDYSDNSYYDVIDTLKGFNWVLIDSFKLISTYRSQLAMGSLHNKVYLCWFTPEISINAGPDKLCGLPGLILEATTNDSKEKYTLNNLFIPAQHKFDPSAYTFSMKQISYADNYANFEKGLKMIQLQQRMDKN